MGDRPTPKEVLARQFGHDLYIVAAVVECLTAAGYRIVPADQRTVADPDGLLPEGELRVFEAWPDVLPRWDVTLIVATPEPSP